MCICAQYNTNLKTINNQTKQKPGAWEKNILKKPVIIKHVNNVAMIVITVCVY